MGIGKPNMGLDFTCTYVLRQKMEILGPSISLERLKIEIHIWYSYSTRQVDIGCQNYRHKVDVVRVVWPKFEIFPLYNLLTNEASSYELQILFIDRLYQAICLWMKNLPLKGCALGHVTHFYRATLMRKHGVCWRPVSVCPSRSCIVSIRLKMSNFFVRPVAPSF